MVDEAGVLLDSAEAVEAVSQDAAEDQEDDDEGQKDFGRDAKDEFFIVEVFRLHFMASGYRAETEAAKPSLAFCVIRCRVLGERGEFLVQRFNLLIAEVTDFAH